MGESVNASLIKLIPKGVKRDLVGGGGGCVQSLSMPYKIIAKALAKRIWLLVFQIV